MVILARKLSVDLPLQVSYASYGEKASYGVTIQMKYLQ